jgi:hypothetical protein
VIDLLDSREITGNVLIQQERFSIQSGENGNEIKVAERFLIPPCAGGGADRAKRRAVQPQPHSSEGPDGGGAYRRASALYGFTT